MGNSGILILWRGMRMFTFDLWTPDSNFEAKTDDSGESGRRNSMEPLVPLSTNTPSTSSSSY